MVENLSLSDSPSGGGVCLWELEPQRVFEADPSPLFHALCRVLAKENVVFERLDDQVRTGFVDQSIVFSISGNYLVASSQWRGEIPVARAADVLGLCHEWNLHQLMPSLRFHNRDAETLALTAVRSFRVAEGVSFNQVGAFVVTSIDAFMACWNNAAVQLPDYVSWDEEL
ncbi:hypothetical protein CFELI_07470 [Corynebacterium felinum]|uniref:YbjN domain-containing protein n=1 Tax=Corynebacterium felinum TaxID=131318 RepID=A0ABU2BAU6_9CORY|nr:YbjN domain-containing protein [Corynebacterium felinum]MDR7355762.1 hypothetical protein [Corynebacterium felinum]WJY95108.1 hypothetical protein CFELI_07470 [Corynebacterium felinum]